VIERSASGPEGRLNDRPPALKGLPPGLEPLEGGAWPGGEIVKSLNLSLTNSLNYSTLLLPHGWR
jgi:hypothetical protein